jgi:outer membrane protein OmpA-like peptidoglycan-associated protein
VNSRGKFDVQLPQSLPERWTLEMDVFLSSFVNNFSVYVVDKSGKPLGEQEILVDAYSGTGIATFESLVRSGTQNIKSLQTEMRVLEKEFTPVRVFVDGGYVKVYVNEVRVANLPQGNLGRSELLRFDFSDVREQPIFLRRIHIAETERSLYDRLLADGRVQTQGIYFDPGKYELKPESTPTLTEIADALRQDSQMNLLVEGHTDNTGESEKNYELSERRAQAVFDYLILNEKISPQRLQFGGMGDSKPVADNSTPEGRQQNRRVELVVLR